MGAGTYIFKRACPGRGWKLVATINGYHWENRLWFLPESAR